MTKVRHLKTGNIYTVISHAINATNGHGDGQSMVVYKNNDQVFVREAGEFYKKFEVIRGEGL